MPIDGMRVAAQFVREVPVRLDLDATEARVIPNLSVNADIILESAPDVVVLPKECVFMDGHKPFAMVETEEGWQKRQLELGLENNLEVAVRAGLKDGETVAAPMLIEPQRKWSIHLVHHSHFDYGYTDPQPMVLDTHLRYLDAAVDLVDATRDWPDEAKFRWNIEVTYPLRKWMAARPASLRDELIRQVKAGRMEVAALPFSMHTEAYSIDDVPWTQYFSGSVALHGAFWHAGFGQVRSHGCVNLSPYDARWLFGFTAPALPPEWHAVSPTKGTPKGTSIVVTE